MLTRVCLGFALLAATPIWAQLESTPFEIPTQPSDEAQMLTPPPVSGEAYPTTVGSETRSNYLSAGLNVNTAYNDNVLGGGSTTPVSDVTYSISPTISLDKTTSRQHLTLTYAPGFTFYQHTSALNAANQIVGLNFQYRLSPHITLTFGDSFQRTSNVFNQLYPLPGGAISGSAQSPQPGVVAPYAERLSNSANAGISYQISRNGMIGASGTFTESNYPNPDEASGLNNTNSGGGSAFYTQRLSSAQYIGVTYQYLKSQSNPVTAQATPDNAQSDTQTHTLLAFYTIYLNPTLSLSLSAGPQYFDITQSLSLPFRSWAPSAMASIGWQRSHTNIVASYSHTVTGAIGLSGAFTSNSIGGSLNWQIARTWNVGWAASYSSSKSVSPSIFSSSSGGHTVSGTVSVQHSMSEHFKAELGYARLNQSYSGITLISNSPDSNREFISVTYQFTRPLGR
jgi:hypothetical protein